MPDLPSARAALIRPWRDLGDAIVALLASVTADAFGVPAALWTVAALTALSGLVAAARMTETVPG